MELSESVRSGLAVAGTAVAVCVGIRWGLNLASRKSKLTKLSMQVSGKPAKKGTPVLAMLAGFPDDHGSWSEIGPRFEATHTVVSMVMPDYDTASLHDYWGYPLPRIVDMLEESMKEIVPAGDKATLMIHDWGAAIGLQYLKRESALERVDRLVLLDVTTEAPFNPMAPLYQLYLASCFLVGRLTLDIFGDIMLAIFPWKAVGPTPYETKLPPRTSGRPRSHMAYPYFWLYWALAFDRGSLRAPRPKGAHPTGPVSVPTTFVYGKNKRVMFHTDRFLKRLKETDGYKAVELDCGHFLQVQKVDELEAIIRERMAM